jgi:5-methylcytosine-specific restriction endonuclease McrA
MSRRIFSEADDLVLQELYSEKTNKELVEVFNGQFSAKQIKYRAKALNLFKTKEVKTRARVAKGWELWEMELIQRHYPNEGTVKCQEYLPHRSTQAIRYKAQRMGLELSEEAKRTSTANGPKYHTEETKQKISQAAKGRKWSRTQRESIPTFKSGSEHPSYIDGRSYRKPGYSSGWEGIRKEIKARDEVCKVCGKRNLLVIHHIDCNKKNSIPSNLVTLCRKCHAKVHKDLDRYVPILRNILGPQELSA